MAPKQAGQQTTGGDDLKRSVSGKVAVTGDVTVHLPANVVQADTEVSDRRERREVVKQWVEGITLIFVIIVAGLTLVQTRNNQLQVDATLKQTKLLREQLVLDQRPILKTSPFIFNDPYTGKPIDTPLNGQPLEITIPFTNVGKSPALKVFSYRYVAFGANARETFSLKRPVVAPWVRGTVMPTEVVSTTAISRKDPFRNQSPVVAPTDWVLWDGSYPIVLFGDLVYEDAFGGTYCTEVAAQYEGHTWFNLQSSVSNPCLDQPKLED